MNSVIISIGGNVVSDEVIEVDTWGNKLTNIGTCRLRIDNTGNLYGGVFASNDVIAITVNAVPIWAGLVDNIKPYVGPRGFKTNQMIVTGRDYGRYLTDYHDTGDYGTQLSADTIDDILLAQGDPLLYTPPVGSPSIKYETNRTFLSDAFREIAEQSAYSFNIHIDGRLHYFPVGTVGPAADLISDPATPASNNLLSFETYESIGFDIKNYIEIHSGSVRDHWTEENAADWDETGAAVCTDETTIKMYGAGSIKVVCGDNDDTVWLDFSGAGLYSHVNLDLTKYGQCKVCVRPEAGSLGNFCFRPYLKDTGNLEIWFTRRKEGEGSKGFTEDINGAVAGWSPISFPVGAHSGNPIYAAARSGAWHGNTAFDWANVKYIGFQIITTDDMDTLYFDALSIPPVEALSIQEDAGVGSSQALYGIRRFHEYRKEFRSQKQIDVYCAKMLELKKDIVQKFKAVAKGETGTLYVSEYVRVRAPDHGINALTDYIIVKLHHRLHHGRNIRGWEYITEYDLVAAEAQDIRVIRDDNYMHALLRELRRLRRLNDGTITDDEYWQGEVMTGIVPQITEGSLFPTDANNGDLYNLRITVTVGPTTYYPGVYRYDASTATWEKASNTTLDGIDDGDFYGNVMHNGIHQLYMKTQHCKFEGESFDGVSITASPGYTLTDGLSYIKMVTDNDVDDNVILTGTGTSFSRQPSVDQIPLAFRARVRFTDPTTSFDMFLMMSSSNGAQDGAFGWWIPAETGQLTRFWTKGGVWTTSVFLTPVRNLWYILEARFDPSTGIGFLEGSDENDYWVAIQDATLTIDEDINPMWVSIHTKAARTATLEMSYWAATLDWRTL